MRNHLVATALFLANAAAAAGTGTITGKVTATPDKYLKETFVFLKEVPGQYPAKTHSLDQKGLQFVPHLLTVTAGDTVRFLNNDNVDHGVYSPDGETYNLGLFPKGQAREQKFSKTGVYSQLCSVHPEMLAYIFVGQNPYAATIQKDGSFKIENVPPGSWQISIWNPKLKAADAPVVVAAGKTAKADFALAR
jgi:plastocyanin